MSVTMSATFDGTNLGSMPGVKILDVSKNYPRRKLYSNVLARMNKRNTTGGFYVERYPTVRVLVQGNTLADKENYRDTLLSKVQGISKTLVITKNTTLSRQFTATLLDVEVLKDEPFYMEMNLVFQCDDNFGYDTSATTILNASAQTSGNRSDSYNFAGSSDYQSPIITISYTAVSDGEGKTVTVGSSTTGQQISVTRDWETDDVLVIDCMNMSVTVNDEGVDFSGAFPQFPVGTSSVTYTDNFTSRTYDYLITYLKRWVI